jgi:putative tryptophan/tyrosine transport system substrate-binding protein
MKRREFITLLGGAAVTWPLPVHAQQGERMRRIGVLQAISESDPEAHLRKAAFVGGLQKLGWTEGTNVTIDYRWAGADADRIRLYVTEITGMRPDVIWTSGALPLLPLKRATRTVPIVFTQVYDPVGSGFVASLTRPGGNVTGLSVQQTDIIGKRLELLREVVPRLRRLAIMVDVGFAQGVLEMGEVKATARTLGLEVTPLEIRRAEDIAPAFEALKHRGRRPHVLRTQPVRYLPAVGQTAPNHP